MAEEVSSMLYMCLFVSEGVMRRYVCFRVGRGIGCISICVTVCQLGSMYVVYSVYRTYVKGRHVVFLE